MRSSVCLVACALFIIANGADAQEYDTTDRGRHIKIQRLVRDVLGKTVTLNFKTGESIEGTLIRAHGTEFVLEVDGKNEIFQTQSIRSFTLRAGLAEGILVLLSAGLVAGFGVGAATLSFDGIQSNVLIVVAVVFGTLGGWLGYDSFFQDVEIVLP